MELCSLPAIYLKPNYGGGNEDNGDLLQRIPGMYCYTHCLQPWIRSPLTHASTGVSWKLLGKSGSASCGVSGQFSWSLSIPHGQGSVCALQESVSQSCVSSGSSMVGLTVTSKRAYAIPKSAARRAPAPAAGLCWPSPAQETLKHSSVSVSVGSLGPGVHKVCLSPLSVSGSKGVWFETWICLSYHLAWASPLTLGMGHLLTVGLPHSLNLNFIILTIGLCICVCMHAYMHTCAHTCMHTASLRSSCEM